MGGRTRSRLTASVVAAAPWGSARLELLQTLAIDGDLLAAEPALLAQLGRRRAVAEPGVEALAAAVAEVVGGWKRVDYDQLRGDYGEF